MLRNGFTLLEAVVSLAILSLAGLAALSAVGQDLAAANRARAALEASALAEERLETVRLLDAESLASLPDSLARGSFPPPLDAYAWSISVTPVVGGYGIFQIQVEIRWDDGARELAARVYRPPAAIAGLGTRGELR